MKKTALSNSTFTLFMSGVGKFRRTIGCALGAMALVACGSVRNQPQSQATIDVPFDLGVGISSVEIGELSEGWSDNFQPPGGTMEVEDQPVISFAFGVQPEFRQRISSGLLVGALARYQLYFPGGIDQTMSKTVVEWWDPVTVRSISLRRTPSLGALLAIDAPHYQQFRFQVTGFYYSLARLYYRGVDNVDARNSSVVDHREVLRRGLGLGVGFDFRPPWTNENYGRMGVYLDDAWSAWTFGIGWRFTIPLYESESKIETNQ